MCTARVSVTGSWLCEDMSRLPVSTLTVTLVPEGDGSLLRARPSCTTSPGTARGAHTFDTR